MKSINHSATLVGEADCVSGGPTEGKELCGRLGPQVSQVHMNAVRSVGYNSLQTFNGALNGELRRPEEVREMSKVFHLFCCPQVQCATRNSRAAISDCPAFFRRLSWRIL